MASTKASLCASRSRREESNRDGGGGSCLVNAGTLTTVTVQLMSGQQLPIVGRWAVGQPGLPLYRSE